MDEVVKSPEQTPVVVDAAGLEVGKWLGRHEAFSLIAGRCSAAEIETVRQIRDERLYEELKCNWEECCTRHLHASRRSVERELGYLRKYGPAFFTVRQLTHISVREYQSIAGQITDQGVNLDGALIPLHAQNSCHVAAAVEELLKRAEPAQDQSASAGEPEPFSALLKRCQAVVRQLESFDGGLDPEQRLELGKAVAEIRAAAAGKGVAVWDRR